MADLVEPFDPQRYNDQATVAENLLFGVPTSRELMGQESRGEPAFRDTLDETGTSGGLVAMGLKIAETMTEIFRDLPPGHPRIEQFSFIGADELGEFEAILRRRDDPPGAVEDRRGRLLALPLAYVEPRHRLGLLDDPLGKQLVRTRAAVHHMFERQEDPGVDFYDVEQVCAAAPLKDSLPDWRVSYRVANAQTRVTEAISAVVAELGLREAVERIGLDHQVGPAGQLLSAQQRTSVSLVRSLVKRPDILVVDRALAPFDEGRAKKMLRLLLELSKAQPLLRPAQRPAGRCLRCPDALRAGDGLPLGLKAGPRTGASPEMDGRRGGMTLEDKVQSFAAGTDVPGHRPGAVEASPCTSEQVQFAGGQRFFSRETPPMPRM